MHISIIPISVINKAMEESNIKSKETFGEVLKREERKLWHQETSNSKQNMKHW